ncbi:isochorismatase [Phlyctema vagabunda]|uniref:nicotinamidase n=1 Tax=Phlyctema vagabunda TaxID=108571 RepID=A0ABR4PB33_9HELO
MLRSVIYLAALAASAIAVPFSNKVHRNTALVVIDVQNDFITGSLANSRAPAILPRIYKLLDQHEWPIIIASQDWHPIGHVSFASSHPGEVSGNAIEVSFTDSPNFTEQQGLYADHCVPETWGAQIEDGVQSRLHNLEGYRTTVNYIKKAQNHTIDSYSAFTDNQYRRFTTLDSELRLHSIERLVITGLITSACVRGTAIDGTKLGYQVTVIEDATDSISQDSKDSAIEELRSVWNVNVISLAQWESENPVPAGPSGW